MTKEELVTQIVDLGCEMDRGDITYDTALTKAENLIANSVLLPEDAIEFAEWIRTFDPLEKKNGFWISGKRLSSEDLYYHYLRDRARWRKSQE